jgi:hypothetical protein
VRRGARLPGDAAELVLSDVLVEQLAGLTPDLREEVLAAVVRLCADPAGDHPLSGVLAGWNTLSVLRGRSRVVHRVDVVAGVGLIEVLCLGPRSDSEVYDVARALVASGLLTDDEITALWDALAVLDVVAERVGLDGWDFRPEPAPEGMRRAAVAAGLLDAEVADLLGRDEVEAAMCEGWGPAGPDPVAALVAALERARDRAVPLDADGARAVLASRGGPRCGAVMPRARRRCVRRAGHPGPHRGR